MDLGNHYIVDCVMLQNSPSLYAWNVKIIDYFSIFLLVISVLRETPHSEGFEFLPLPWQVFPASSTFSFHFLLAGTFQKQFPLQANLQA